MATDFAHFFDLSLDLLATIEPQGRILDVNPAWEESVGFDREELSNAAFFDFIHRDDRPEMEEMLSRASQGEPVRRHDSRFRCKDGRYKWLSWTMNYHAGDNLAYCIARDITSFRNEMEERERNLEDAQRMQGMLMREREQAHEAITSMATPIIEIWDDVVTLPVVGVVDSVRAAEMKEALLASVARTGARIAIVDMTGVDTVDTATADHILRLMQGVKLLGAKGIITGIQPAVAQIMVSLGVDIGGVMTLRSLREGLRYSLHVMGYRVVSADA